jgi:hypothetical protein
MIKQQLPHTLGEDKDFASIIALIKPLHLEELALTTRRKLFSGLLPETSCIASTPPRVGSFNIVYELSFSDGIKWAIRLPAEGDVFRPSRSRSFYLDIVTQRFISSNTSMPIPRIHYWSLDSNNILSRPFVIMDLHVRDKSLKALERQQLDHRPQAGKNIRAGRSVDGRTCRTRV